MENIRGVDQEKLVVSTCLINSVTKLFTLLASAEEESVSFQGLTIFSFCCFSPLQMLGELFMPQHTSRRGWCSSSGVEVSLPSWPPSSRSPPHQESYSPSMNQNTGNPSVILFVLRLLLLLRTTSPPRFTERSGLKLNPEINWRITHGRWLLMCRSQVYCEITPLEVQVKWWWEAESASGIMHQFLLCALARKISFNVLYL